VAGDAFMLTGFKAAAVCILALRYKSVSDCQPTVYDFQNAADGEWRGA